MKIKQFFKKAAAMVMAAVTVLSLLPATAFAATGDVGTICCSNRGRMVWNYNGIYHPQ